MRGALVIADHGVMRKNIRIVARRIGPTTAAIAALCLLTVVIGVLLFRSYDGRSTTQRIADCLIAAGYDLQVVHDDGKEPLGGDEGLLGPLGDYQARPPSDSIFVARLDTGTRLVVITVQSGSARVAFSVRHPDRASAAAIDDCAG